MKNVISDNLKDVLSLPECTMNEISICAVVSKLLSESIHERYWQIQHTTSPLVPSSAVFCFPIHERSNPNDQKCKLKKKKNKKKKKRYRVAGSMSLPPDCKTTAVVVSVDLRRGSFAPLAIRRTLNVGSKLFL